MVMVKQKIDMRVTRAISPSLPGPLKFEECQNVGREQCCEKVKVVKKVKVTKAYEQCPGLVSLSLFSLFACPLMTILHVITLLHM